MFNITKVNSQLRSSNFLSWYREEKTDYICNGYFIIKTDLTKEENRKILGTLVEIFRAIPEKNRGLEFKGKTIATLYNKPDWFKSIGERPKKTIEDTKLIQLERVGNIRIFKGEDYIYINMKYLEMIKDISLVRLEGGKALDAITATNGENLLLILPIRIGSDNEYLVKEKDLSAATE